MKRTFLVIVGILLWNQWFCMGQTKESFPLYVGAAKVDITQRQPLSPATGKYDHERFYARAIVLDNGDTRAALISFDCRMVQPLWTDVFKQIIADLNCPIENIIIATTHSHSNNRFLSSQGSYVYSNAAPSTHEEMTVIADGIIEAVRQAKAKLQPALMGFGRGMSYLNVNRDAIDSDTRQWTQAANLDGWSDKSVDVIKFETPNGKPIAVFMNYAMHPINGFVMGVLSADFPGSVCRYVEKAFNDEIVVAFSQGAQGDQNPLYLRPSTNAIASRIGLEITGYELNREEAEGPLRMFRNPGDEPKAVDAKALDDLFRFIESQGQILGEEVIRVMTVTRKMTRNVYIAGKDKVVTCPGRRRIGGDNMNPATREGVSGVYEDAPDVSIKVGMLGIGTTAIVWSNGEVFSYIGQRVKKESPLTKTMFMGVTNAEPGSGYIPNDAAYGEQTFQVLNTKLKPGCAEQAIVNTLVDMVTEYLEQ